MRAAGACGRVALVAILGCAAPAAGCVLPDGRQDFRPTRDLASPFKAFGRLEVGSFELAVPAEGMGDLPGDLAGRIAKSLDGTGLFGGEGRVLRVEGRITHIDPGSRSLRFWCFYGEGEGALEARVSFRDDAGSTVAEGVARGTVLDGF